MKSKKWILGVATLFVIAFAIGCNDKDSYSDIHEYIKVVAKETKYVTPALLKIKIDSAEAFNLIDVREAGEFNAGYIPGATNIPRGVLEFNINNEKFWENEGLYLPEKEELFILVCKKGGRSTLAAKAIRRLGYERVMVLQGGWKSWELTYPDIFEKNLDANAHEEEEEVGGC
jgi:rhodanese-related sulfurtransferase